MNKPALVASDVDGTLLDPSVQVSERTARTVRAVVDDTPFVLVTGRPPRWVPQIVDGLGVAGIAVCSNGAVVYDAEADRVVHRTEMEPEQLRDAARDLREALPGCTFAVERSTGRARDDVAEQFLAEAGFHRVWPNRDIRVVERAELFDRPAAKLMVLHEDSRTDLVPAVEEVLGPRLCLTCSMGGGPVELSAPGVDKASGLAFVADAYGVPPDAVIGFGDMPNDIPMLDWVGHAVAMSNAHPGVLEIADEITTCNGQDGVAQVLERWWP
ncbi:HAD family hydrolase [Saccharopolyspora sp. NPDC047091]|uniref:HAD family hydrolase n=1 Tax=Saccharopolyspora sp. NPDC047091 TaxID=3155924 RepID=UPI0033EFD8F7